MNSDINIFAEVNNRLLAGTMFHDEMYRYYLFLRLYSFANEHKKRHKEEMNAYQKLNKYFITHRNILIQNRRVTADSFIPTDWYSKSRKDISNDELRDSTMFAMNKWVTWEKKTKELYTEGYNSLIKLGYASEADLILELVKDVDNELKEAEDLELKLKGMNYDPIEIMGMNK